MALSNRLKVVAIVGLAGVLAFALSPPADAAKKVRWKMQSAFSSKLPIVGEIMVRFSANIKRLSGGTLEIKYYEPGALVPPLEGFEVIKRGSVDAFFGVSGYHAGRIPALAWFTAVPFGPGPSEYLAWLYNGGGDKIYDRIYAEHGLKGLHCGMVAPEASGWFRKEIKSLADLKGLKIRYGGLGARVMQKMGASTQLLAPSDIYPALERGVIDAAEFSMPSIDRILGFYQIAKHYYFPGWHQQSTVIELLMNKKKWDALSDRHRAIIEITCGDNIRHSIALAESSQPEALEFLKSRGVQIHRWPPEFMAAFRKAWEEVLAEQSASDPLFKEIAESYLAFRKKYALWKDLGYLK